jgi:hypothetical protein
MTPRVAGRDERDEPPGAGATRWRVEDQPARLRHREDEPGEAVSVDARLTLLRCFYGARIEAARRDLPASQRAAAVVALRQELKAATRALLHRERSEKALRRARLRLARPLREGAAAGQIAV